MSECRPPDGWRDHQWHLLEAEREVLGWHPPQVFFWRAPAAWMGDELGWSNDFGLSADSPDEAAAKGWTYAFPILGPEKIEKLRVVLEQASATLETLHPQAGGDMSLWDYVGLWKSMLLEIDATLTEIDSMQPLPPAPEPTP